MKPNPKLNQDPEKLTLTLTKTTAKINNQLIQNHVNSSDMSHCFFSHIQISICFVWKLGNITSYWQKPCDLQLQTALTLQNRSYWSRTLTCFHWLIASGSRNVGCVTHRVSISMNLRDQSRWTSGLNLDEPQGSISMNLVAQYAWTALYI